MKASIPMKRPLYKLLPISLCVVIFLLSAGWMAVPARSEEEESHYVIAYGKEITIASSVQHSADAVLTENGFDAAKFIIDATEHEDFTVLALTDALAVTVVCDGDTSTSVTVGGTVGEHLTAVGVQLGEEDIVTPELTQPVFDGLKITVYRVTCDFTLEEVAVPYSTEYTDDPELEKGETRLVSEGMDGVRTDTYKNTYVNGEISGTELMEQIITVEPTAEVIARGAKEPPKPEPAPAPTTTTQKPSTSAASSSGSSASSSAGSSGSASSGSTSSGSSQPQSPSTAPSEGASSDSSPSSSGGSVTTASGEALSYSKVLNMKATAYTYTGTGADITASGAPVQVGIVAALPSVLPLGTRVYITAADGSWTYGVAVVGDICGSNLIDLFFETNRECVNFGVRNALVYVLN